jgi:hypothetical protein
MVQHLQTITIRQTHVGKTKLIGMVSQQLVGLSASSRSIGLMPHPMQCKQKQLTNICFIVND